MDTTIKTNREQIYVASGKTSSSKNSGFLKNAESNRFGITPILLIVMSCMGGFAAASGIMDSWVKLAAVAFPATISLAMILAIAPMRVIFISIAIALAMDVLVILF